MTFFTRRKLPSNLCSGAHKCSALRYTGVYLKNIFSFVLEYSHGAFHQLDGVQTIPGYKNINVLSGGSLHRVPCPILAAAGGLFCGFGSTEGSSKQRALPFAVMVQMPSLDHWLQVSLQKHLLLVTVSSFAVRPHLSLHTAVISAACFWLTSP